MPALTIGRIRFYERQGLLALARQERLETAR
jgi:hypothetical protein